MQNSEPSRGDQSRSSSDLTPRPAPDSHLPHPHPLADRNPSENLLKLAERVARPWLQSLVVHGQSRMTNAARPDEPQDARQDGSLLDASAVVDAAADALIERLGLLLQTDVEQQRENPLAVFRQAVLPINDFLTIEGHPPPRRDAFDRDRFPEDTFGLMPATWADIHPDLAPVGLQWGAWKAATILARRRSSDGDARPT